MPEAADSVRWQAVGLVIDQNARDFLAGRYALAQELVAWLKAVDLFRAAEDERMILRDPTPEDLRQHRTWLASLIAEGERLVTEAHAQGGVLEGVRFKLADVEATIENLRIDERLWHGETMSPERRRELLKALFDVQESAA
jgi:hypothetical protein